MRHFRYQAMDVSGERREGDLRAANADEARQSLRAKGLFVTALTETEKTTHGSDSSLNRGRDGNQAVVAAWGFLVIGTLFALFGFGWGVRSFCLLTGAKRTTGTVVQLREETTSRVGESGTETTWHPVVEYEVDGVKYRTEGDVGSTPTWLPRVGENVEVLYPADQPASGRLNTFLDNWAIPLVFGGVGSVFAALGIFMVHSDRR